jgi:hypothetical protein
MIDAKKAKRNSQKKIMSIIEMKIEKSCGKGEFAAEIEIPRHRQSILVEKAVKKLKKNGFEVRVKNVNGPASIIKVSWYNDED